LQNLNSLNFYFAVKDQKNTVETNVEFYANNTLEKGVREAK